jgi:beta-phosphoglucomutase family hydrolase
VTPAGEAKVRALLFDMDGVLVDSNPLHRVAWEEFNRRYGIETTDEMHQQMYGKRNDQIVRDFFGESLTDAEVDARGHAKEALYREMATGRIEQLLVPGIRGILEKYYYLPKAVVTNAEPDNVNFLLDGAGLRTAFHVVVDGHQVARPKPHPDIYLRAAELLGERPENCVVFEDSHSGVAAGLSAGMRVIGLTTTHVNLPGTCFTIDNFQNGKLASWLKAQCRPL